MFRLKRYYSVASLIGMGVVVVGLSMFYRQVAVTDLIEHETRANVRLTTAFANSIWPRYADFVAQTSSLSADELRDHPRLARLDADIRRQMKGLGVAKVKIYSLDGNTAFSTDPTQLGADKSNNKGFLAARDGRTASELTFRNEFYALEGVISDRDVLSSYIPIKRTPESPVEGVFELYSDVTGLTQQIKSTQVTIVVGVSAALGLLYLFLYAIVGRADTIIRAQESERRQAEDRIRHQAYHDALTGLANRSNFIERVAEAIKRCDRQKRAFGIMFLDLDRFKVVNDSLGHDAGDVLLKVAARRIQDSVRESDMVFRMGGDEFTVILESLDRPENAVLVAQRIIDAMSAPIPLGNHEVFVTTSIGITIYPRDQGSAERLIKNADAAMYRAKESGTNRYEFYTPDMNVRAMERLELETALQRALSNDEFVLFYQPKVATESGDVVGAEALLRWQRPGQGTVAPDQFIPFLEDTGLIIPVGEWVLRTACAQNKRWQDEGQRAIQVSVNISARQFRSDTFVTTVKQVLHETGLDPKYLELELTESLLVENAEKAIAVMQELKEIGVTISIDDFGTGYSSLNYLKQFPVDLLKIDRSFIIDLHSNPKDAAITSAIAALAHNLDLGLVAEGVEEDGQVDFLRAQGYQQMQGYLFGRPMPVADMTTYLGDPAAARKASGPKSA